MDNILSIDPGLNNLAIVNLNINEDNNININYSNIYDIKKKSVSETIDNLINNLNGIGNFNIVLIENPPALKNPQLKTIAIAIYTYFKLKCPNVHLINPSIKLNKEENKKTYKERKKASIENGLNLLNENDKREIERYKKKDDILDCVNQAYAFYQRNKIKSKK